MACCSSLSSSFSSPKFAPSTAAVRFSTPTSRPSAPSGLCVGLCVCAFHHFFFVEVCCHFWLCCLSPSFHVSDFLMDSILSSLITCLCQFLLFAFVCIEIIRVSLMTSRHAGTRIGTYLKEIVPTFLEFSAVPDKNQHDFTETFKDLRENCLQVFICPL